MPQCTRYLQNMGRYACARQWVYACMCVCVCVYVCMCVVCLNVCNTCKTWAGMHVQDSGCMHACMCVCVCVKIHACVHACMVYLCVCTQVFMYMFVFANMYAFAYAFIIQYKHVHNTQRIQSQVNFHEKRYFLPNTYDHSHEHELAQANGCVYVHIQNFTQHIRPLTRTRTRTSKCVCLCAYT